MISVSSNKYLYIDKTKDYSKLRQFVIDSLHIHDIDTFDSLAKQYDVPKNLKTGKYTITPDESARDILKKITRGNQTPTKVVFNNVRLKNDLAESVGNQLMFSSADLLELLKDPTFCATYGYDTTTVITFFIPNTYEVYWDIAPEKFVERMYKEYNTFWNSSRKEKAQALNDTSAS